MAPRGRARRVQNVIVPIHRPEGAPEGNMATQADAPVQAPRQGPPQEEVQPPNLSQLPQQLEARMRQVERQEASRPVQSPPQGGTRSDNHDPSYNEGSRKTEEWPVAMVIQGSDPLDSWGSNKSAKRTWKEILSISSTSDMKEGPDRPPLAFTNHDLHDGKPNLHIPLLISAIMANMEVRRILVDQGSAVD